MDHIKICDILFVLLAFKLVFIKASWSTPPFEEPENHVEADVKMRYYSNTKLTIIEFNEEVNHSFCIAKIINFADSDSPQIGRFDYGNNELLGASIENENGVWKIYVTNKQDYEYPLMQKYAFIVTSGSSSYNIDIHVRNIDDNAPIIRSDQQSCEIQENYQDTINCSYTISDEDGSINNITLTFISTPIEGKHTFDFLFDIISDNKVRASLILQKSLDFETTAMYMLTLNASDEGNNQGSLTSVIHVIDMPDELPKWMRLTTSETIKEKTSHTFEILAKDGDVQINAEINYRIKTETEEEIDLIKIGKESGKVVINPIDRDKLHKEVFRFQVFAYETENIQSEINASIIIIVEDINDNIPTIFPEKNLSITIREESYITLNFSPPISVSDPDLADHAQYSVHLKDNSKYHWSSAFRIIPNTGYQTTNFTISVVNASLLDYEDEHWRNMQIQVEAVETHNLSHIGQRIININLENWNDERPTFDHETLEVTVPEDVGINVNIATMLAIDRDINDIVKHSLTAQKDFIIDEKKGHIKTKVENSLDYESIPMFLVQVVATDLVNHTAYGTLIINVKDVNDVPPKLYLPTLMPSLEEEASLNTTVENIIIANDPDTDAKLHFNIDWNTTKAFKNSVVVDQSFYYKCLTIQTNYVDNSSGNAEGVFVVSGRIDYELFDVMIINVSVTDLMTKHNKNTTYASLTLNIIDINDNFPHFNEIKSMAVNENEISGTVVGSVTAIDEDGLCCNQMSYFMKPLNYTGNDLLQINENTGEIQVIKGEEIDAEKYEFLYYNITATDGQLENTTEVRIYVNDMNDNEPQLLNDKFNSTIHIWEKSPHGTGIVTIYAKDLDRSCKYSKYQFERVLLHIFYTEKNQSVHLTAEN
ncbi:cadherin-related family member 2-like [Chelonus insularis]|uniref:cadherin-related family member 2-like n=1 Tax=Chelonus insularis TaxID=460826 RepID=UPI00158F237B|nr:cadherin-related family member 2-like [Chelonus insularis]